MRHRESGCPECQRLTGGDCGQHSRGKFIHEVIAEIGARVPPEEWAKMAPPPCADEGHRLAVAAAEASLAVHLEVTESDILRFDYGDHAVALETRRRETLAAYREWKERA